MRQYMHVVEMPVRYGSATSVTFDSSPTNVAVTCKQIAQPLQHHAMP